MKKNNVSSSLISILVRFIKISFFVLQEVSSYKRFLKNKDMQIPKKLVNTLIDMGPTFVKLGQILSTRPDLLPKEYISELRVLHDNVPPFSYEKVRGIVKKEFGKEIELMFKSFDTDSIAAASLSQVHFAVLPDNSEVAVKIQRPNTREIIQKDNKVLSWMVNILGILSPKLSRNVNLKGAFHEFKSYTLKELDFSLEGKTLEKFRNNFKDWDDIIFPGVFWDYTTSKILTMERISGLKLDDVKNKMSPENRVKLNKRLVEVEMKMFISDAFFHADLHPGNIFFKEDGRIAIIDVGMFGSLTEIQRDRFLLYWLAIVSEEKRRAFHHLIKLGTTTSNADEDSFYHKFCEILDQFYRSNISERSLTKTYLEIFISGAKFGFIFPSQLLLQAKALTTAEALAFVLVPDFKFTEAARPIVTRELSKRAELEAVKKRLKQSIPEWLLLGENVDEKIIFSKDEDNKFDNGWKDIAKVWAKEFDDNRNKGKEVRHGEFDVIINESIDKVFNFVTRFAQYPNWHPTYTLKSRVIHVSARYVRLSRK